jgi:hypothetical protein
MEQKRSGGIPMWSRFALESFQTRNAPISFQFILSAFLSSKEPNGSISRSNRSSLVVT